MAFDINAQGNIDSLPLFTYETAIAADAICLLRLVLARHEDEPEIDAVCVQLTMSAEQASELAQELQKMVRLIAEAAPKGKAH
jgi:hypothetical protein